ncbi:hypothetical protein [uncultured Alteromonas sp.]|uniref:hypothetical protein n=1 Tax=uncultured Alteromonas sp. TaxID=179113 RepID=UPI0030CE255A|tara:strand:- start:26401 stop:26784 length:384 start_codon:yes stop_codon:yes gene_type:complete
MAKFGRAFLKLTDSSREKLLKLYPPRFSAVLAEHITLEHGSLTDTDYQFSKVSVVGYQSTSYLDVLVVAIDGSCIRPFDKGVLHITLSTQPGIAPACSNYVLSVKQYEKTESNLELDVEFQTKIYNF